MSHTPPANSENEPISDPNTVFQQKPFTQYKRGTNRIFDILWNIFFALASFDAGNMLAPAKHQTNKIGHRHAHYVVNGCGWQNKVSPPPSRFDFSSFIWTPTGINFLFWCGVIHTFRNSFFLTISPTMIQLIGSHTTLMIPLSAYYKCSKRISAGGKSDEIGFGRNDFTQQRSPDEFQERHWTRRTNTNTKFLLCYFFSSRFFLPLHPYYEKWFSESSIVGLFSSEAQKS